MPTTAKQETAPTPAATISEAQAKRLFAIAHKANLSQEDLRLHLRGLGIEHSTEIPRDRYDEICAWAESGGQDAPGDARELPV
jgi:hypothetical protein